LFHNYSPKTGLLRIALYAAQEVYTIFAGQGNASCRIWYVFYVMIGYQSKSFGDLTVNICASRHLAGQMPTKGRGILIKAKVL